LVAEKEITHSSRRINAIARAIGASKYLEIGVAAGDTFFDVSVTDKTAVDPKFRFDVAENKGDDNLCKFYEMGSDEYFINIHAEEKFDIVFIDGLHVFSQTFRDFCNSLSATHEDSVIIIDDTIPSDVYSSVPDMSLSLACRFREGGQGADWHGDVFKMIYAVHDFFPWLSYVTISNNGNPQTVIWRERRRFFRPRFDSFELISRMTWFDLQTNLDLANFETESEAIDRVSLELAKRKAEVNIQP
jgi:hypothetical protein